MDCVLADFVAGALKAHHVSFEDVEPYWPIGTYGMTKPIGMIRTSGAGFTEQDFWEPINNSVGFWRHLDPLPWFARLVDLVKATTDDWWVVSTPSYDEKCVPEKRLWLERRLGKSWGLLVPTGDKHLLANPHTALIDDCDANVVKFKQYGGHGIVFPTYHNTRHELRHDPVSTVERTLARLQGTM